MATIITLTTDFGVEDGYVAALKGVILGINPRATVVDICHQIEAQNIAQGAFVLMTACPYFPDGSIHLAIVDPEVGGGRRAIALRTGRAVFIGPDNGVLSHAALRASAQDQPGGGVLSELPPGVECFEISNPRYWRQPVSPTFHGRDVFAPVAAHVSAGVALSDLGRAVGSIRVLPFPRPEALERGGLLGHVLHIDHFGNIITDIQRGDLPPGRFRLEVGHHSIASLGRTYCEAEGLTALIGSSDHLEIALRNGSAARFLGLGIGDPAKLVRDR
ncbi:MAG: SAM-dependent chlorinase/fluorinase [Chloroflexi bacterium]|nr:SAM-dependent chlorinase/fluorinase [Chloroflexota bacterium]